MWTSLSPCLKATLAASLTTAGAEGITAEDMTVTGKSFEVGRCGWTLSNPSCNCLELSA